MVKLFGHLAMGLLWAAPAWFLWDGRVALAFVAFVTSTSLLPDIDFYLGPVVEGIHHHGVMHTVVFVVGVAVAAGWLATTALDQVLKRWWVREEQTWPSTAEVYTFVTGGLVLGGLSHLFADILSAPDGYQALEPFWPVITEPVVVDVIYYADPRWNLGFFAVAVALHLLLVYLDAGPTLFAELTDS